MRIGYGHGGWVRVDDTDPGLPGPLYLRYAAGERGRPVLVELYLDGGGREIRGADLRSLDLPSITTTALADDRGWLQGSTQMAGPDISLLAAHYATSYGSYAGDSCPECGGPTKAGSDHRAVTDWTALAWFAQIQKSGIRRPTRPREHPGAEPIAPAPVRAPEGPRLTDDFLQSVAENYVWAARLGEDPAPFIFDQLHRIGSIHTVRAWIKKARARGYLLPTTRGRVG